MSAECTMTHAEYGNCPTTIVSTPTIEQHTTCAEMDAVLEKITQEKIKKVMRRAEMKEIETGIYETSVETSKSMRNIQKHYEIENSELS